MRSSKVRKALGVALDQIFKFDGNIIGFIPTSWRGSSMETIEQMTLFGEMPAKPKSIDSTQVSADLSNWCPLKEVFK